MINDTKKLYQDYQLNSLKNGLNFHKIPKISKITLQTGIKKLINLDSNNLSIIKEDYLSITQQKPVVIKSLKNIAAFSLRIGDTVGIKVTLRKNNMYDFLNRLLFLVIPRLKFFEGFENNIFDKQGNFTIGISDMSIFYELDPSIRKVLNYGSSITFTIINSQDIKEIKNMLKQMCFYFKTEK